MLSDDIGLLVRYALNTFHNRVQKEGVFDIGVLTLFVHYSSSRSLLCTALPEVCVTVKLFVRCTVAELINKNHDISLF